VSRCWRDGRLTLAAVVVLLLTTGCALLDVSKPSTEPPVHTVDPDGPFLVVTVGGSPAATATPGVAETIPESTPLPRIDPPTRDPAATARPVASPSLNRAASAAAQAARPPSVAPPAASPTPAARVP
jgi:hypothetical protein